MFKWFGKVNFVPYTKVGEFAEHLKNGKLMGTKCLKCGTVTFPPEVTAPPSRRPTSMDCLSVQSRT